VVAACLATFGGSLGNGLVWDDLVYVTPAVMDRAWSSLWRMLGSDLVRAGDWYASPSGYWRPLASLTFWADAGLPGGAVPFHASNLAFHAASAVLLVVLLTRRLGKA
jgi:hypothetical protein